MKILMRVSFATAEFSAGPNDVIDIPAEDALRLINKGYAAALGGTVIETAILPPAEETRDEVEADDDADESEEAEAPVIAAAAKPKKKIKKGKRR